MWDRPIQRGGVGLSKAATVRLIGVLWAGLTLGVFEAQAEEVYRWIDSRGVVHLTNVPSDSPLSRNISWAARAGPATAS